MTPHDLDLLSSTAGDGERRWPLQFELRLLRNGPAGGWSAELLPPPPAPRLVFDSLADLIGFLARLDGQASRRGIR